MLVWLGASSVVAGALDECVRLFDTFLFGHEVLDSSFLFRRQRASASGIFPGSAQLHAKCTRCTQLYRGVLVVPPATGKSAGGLAVDLAQSVTCGAASGSIPQMGGSSVELIVNWHRCLTPA